MSGKNGFVMICSADTVDYCLQHHIFGGRENSYKIYQSVKVGDNGFLINTSTDELLGIFEASSPASDPKAPWDPSAWEGKGATEFPVQVKVEQVQQVPPIPNQSTIWERIGLQTYAIGKIKVPKYSIFNPDIVETLLRDYFEVRGQGELPSMMMTSIKIRGFKSIRQADIGLTARNILIGVNGAGKSNFMTVFSLLNQLAEKRLQIQIIRGGGADNFLHMGQKITKKLKIECFWDSVGYDVELEPTVDDKLAILTEKALILEEGHIPVKVMLITNSELESKLVSQNKQEYAAEFIREHLLRGIIYHVPDTSESAKIRLQNDINNNYFLLPDGSNLAPFLRLLQVKHNEEYSNIVDAIRVAFPFFDDFDLHPNPENPQLIQLRWVMKNSNRSWAASALSDGTLRFMCLVTLMLQPSPPKLILIDEPELGLHPHAIRLLAELIQSLSDTQFVIATQSVTFVNQFAPEDIIVVEMQGNESTFHRPDAQALSAWLEEYSLGDLWEKNLLGARGSR